MLSGIIKAIVEKMWTCGFLCLETSSDVSRWKRENHYLDAFPDFASYTITDIICKLMSKLNIKNLRNLSILESKWIIKLQITNNYIIDPLIQWYRFMCS